MLSRPTTEQILLDCRDELLRTVAPAVPEGPVLVAIQMMENVLRNCAARAAHEIAWMHEEADEMVSYAARVAATNHTSTAVTDALAAYETRRDGSLHLDDVTATYSLAGQCLSTAIDAAMAGGDPELQADGRAILEQRLAHENEIMGEWAFVGRA
jgi:hypothetical protein